MLFDLTQLQSRIVGNLDLIAVVLAFVLGMLHALEPGHGKTIAGAFLVGSKGRPIDAVILGLTATIAHTMGVIVLGVLAIFASSYFLPKQLEPVLILTSGGLIVTVGLWVLASWLRRLQKGRADEHSHGWGSHSHTHSHSHEHDHPHDHEHMHDHPVAVAQERPGLRALLAIGISGGIVPCPAALAILLAAIAKQQLVIGLVAVIVFSLGLAVVLVTAGLVVVHANRFAGRVLGRWFDSPRLIRTVQPISAIIIIVLGIVLTLQGMARYV